MDNLIESILLINNYLITSKNKNNRHTVRRYMTKKISDFIFKYKKLNDRPVDIYIPTSTQINTR